MASSKQSIVWTPVLLYHRLKVAARTNNRYRLDLKIICTGVIHKLAFYFKNSVESISRIVGVNGRNTKSIYNRILIWCRYFEIKHCINKKTDHRIFNNNTTTAIITNQLQSSQVLSDVNYICKKADNRIFNSNATSHVMLSQLQSPWVLSDVNNDHDSIVRITQKETATIIVNNNSTNRFREKNNQKESDNLSFPTTISHINCQSSSRIATRKSLWFYKQLVNVPNHLEF